MCASNPKHPKRILVIDDDLDLLMLLERQLIKERYEVETAASIPEAEEIIPAYVPDLVLLDINIHGDDGRQLSWKLKSTPEFKDIKVILMSGYDYNARRAALFGADELLPKPFFMDYLIQRVSNYMNPQESSSLFTSNPGEGMA